MFRSTDPFGLAAIIAYVSSLSLTILFFSVPYFASYFINYHGKLHQIEEAMLLLSEKTISTPSIRDQGGEPTYSSVMDIDAPVPDDTHVYKPPAIPGFDYPELGEPYFASDDEDEDDANDQPIEKDILVEDQIDKEEIDPEVDNHLDSSTDEPVTDFEEPPAPTERSSQTPENESDHDPKETEVIEKSIISTPQTDQVLTQQESDGIPPKEDLIEEEEDAKDPISKAAKPKKTIEDIDREAGQLSLLDTMFETPVEASSEDTGPTTIHAFALLDKGEKLFVRGEFGPWNKKGVLMTQLDVGKYELILHTFDKPDTITFWRNDKHQATNEKQTISPGSSTELYPEF